MNKKVLIQLLINTLESEGYTILTPEDWWKNPLAMAYAIVGNGNITSIKDLKNREAYNTHGNLFRNKETATYVMNKRLARVKL